MMYPHKLKVHIAATLFGVLMLAMLLINIVIFVFWYQHLVQQKVLQVKNTVNAWSSEYLTFDFGADIVESRSALQVLHRALGLECRQVLLLQAERVVAAVDTPDRWGVESVVYSAITSGREVVRQIDRADIPLFFTPKILVIALPNGQQKPENSGLGVVMNTVGIFSELWEKQKIITVYIFINAIVLTIVGFFRMRKVVLQPIEKLVGVAENYQVSEGGGLFSEHTENEFGQLSRAINDMVQRIEEDRQKLCHTVDSLAQANQQLQNAQQESLRAEKLAAAGRLSAGLAHEIGNPVAIIQGYLELLEHSDIPEDERIQFTGRALDELRRIDILLRQLLDVTRIKEAKSEVVDPTDIMKDMFEVLETSFKKKNIQVKYSAPEYAVLVWGDKELLRQVLLNCLINAMDAVVDKQQGSPGGEICAGVRLKDKEDVDMIIMEVRDNGSGICEENLEYIFEPFFTTKDPGKGTGLGLAVSYRIIQSMGGRIEVESEPGKGSVFRIMLPAYTVDAK